MNVCLIAYTITFIKIIIFYISPFFRLSPPRWSNIPPDMRTQEIAQYIITKIDNLLSKLKYV